MTNETTYLENLLNNRKVVRNYKKTSLEDTNLKNISKFSIKIPTAGFSRGIEILNTFDVKKIKNVSVPTFTRFIVFSIYPKSWTKSK